MEQIETRPDDAIVPVRDLIGAFYDLDLLELAIAKTGFDLDQEMDRIVTIINDPDPRVAATGIKLFRALLREVATVSGRIANVRQTLTEKTPQGDTTIREVESGTQLIKRLAHEPNPNFPVKERLPIGSRTERTPPVLGGDVRPAGGSDPDGAEPD